MFSRLPKQLAKRFINFQPMRTLTLLSQQGNKSMQPNGCQVYRFRVQQGEVVYFSLFPKEGPLTRLLTGRSKPKVDIRIIPEQGQEFAANVSPSAEEIILPIKSSSVVSIKMVNNHPIASCKIDTSLAVCESVEIAKSLHKQIIPTTLLGSQQLHTACVSTGREPGDEKL